MKQSVYTVYDDCVDHGGQKVFSEVVLGALLGLVVRQTMSSPTKISMGSSLVLKLMARHGLFVFYIKMMQNINRGTTD